MTQTPNSYIVKYPNFAKRLEQFWARRMEWALSYRVEKMMRGNHTNNYAEAGMRIIKEIVFGRVKAFNLTQMFQFVTLTMEKYDVNRLLDVAHSRYRPGIALRYTQCQLSYKYKNVDVKKVRPSIYVVEVEVDEIGVLEYCVDMDIGTCSCSLGNDGSACGHQAAVAKHFGICSVNLPPFHSKEMRQTFAELAMGKEHTMSTEFYMNLRTCETAQFKTSVTEAHTPTPPIGVQCSQDNMSADENDSMINDIKCYNKDEPNPLEKQLVGFQVSLDEIVNDMVKRVKEGDHNYISGLTKFISSYRKLKCKSNAPTSSIAYAMHNFGHPNCKCIDRWCFFCLIQHVHVHIQVLCGRKEEKGSTLKLTPVE